MGRTQQEINDRIAVAERKREAGDELTEEEWVLIQYSSPQRCHSCGSRFGTERGQMGATGRASDR